MSNDALLAIIGAIVTLFGGGALAKGWIERINKVSEVRIQAQLDESQAKIKEDEYERARATFREDKLLDMLEESLKTLQDNLEYNKKTQTETRLLIQQINEVMREQNTHLTNLISIVKKNGFKN